MAVRGVTAGLMIRTQVHRRGGRARTVLAPSSLCVRVESIILFQNGRTTITRFAPLISNVRYADGIADAIADKVDACPAPKLSNMGIPLHERSEYLLKQLHRELRDGLTDGLRLSRYPHVVPSRI